MNYLIIFFALNKLYLCYSLITSNRINSIINTNDYYINRYLRFFSKKSIFNTLDNILKENIKSPCILNGKKTELKKNMCQILANKNNINFEEYSFDEFILYKPYDTIKPINNIKSSLIYINDFLLNDGRIFNKYEEDILINLKKTEDLIIFESINIDKIVYKDINIINKFNILEFPNNNKADIVEYIYDTIFHNKYNDKLLDIKWKSFDIECINFEKINIMLFELNNHHNNNNKINDSYIKSLIISFI